MENSGRNIVRVKKAFWLVFLTATLGCFQNCGKLETVRGADSSASIPVVEDEDTSPNDPVVPSEPVTPSDPVVTTPDEPEDMMTNITHGSQITSSVVGPAAIGITSFTKVSGGALRDNNFASFGGVEVAGTAVYDGVVVEGPHILIQGKEIDLLDVFATKKLVFRGNKLRGGSYWALNLRSEVRGGVYILFNELGGKSTTVWPGKAMQLTHGGGSVFVYRNDFSLATDGINLYGSNVTMLENYMHDFIGDATAHYDGITNYGGEKNIIIARNKIMLAKSDTGALNIGSGDGSSDNWIVDSNYLAGGGYTCYCGGESNGHKTTNFKFTNNIFGLDFYAKVGYWGPYTWVAPKASGNVYSGNMYSNGALLNF